ncbi:transposase [Candidatus Midichloria mitochondrii]|uniref:transposase n=1 Tax=Candidatus Midichloria mitochondrii TaxID=234827 RepID=UPI00178C7196|nr:transposase [Candidatus Midichloria mitochondrii]
MQATTHVPKILKKLAETKGTRVWDDAFRSYNDPRFVSFEGITGFKDFYLNCFQISLREGLPKLISYNRFVELDARRGHPVGHSAELLQRETNRYVDSTKSWKVCHNLRTSRNKVLKGVAQRGKTSTRMVLWPQ